MTIGRRILIVEDDDDLGKSLKDQLNLHEGFVVTTANTASRGMELAKSVHFKLLLFDVALPDMDGREAVELPAEVGFQNANHYADGQGYFRCRSNSRP